MAFEGVLARLLRGAHVKVLDRHATLDRAHHKTCQKPMIQIQQPAESDDNSSIF
jgi:hypothetical protein